MSDTKVVCILGMHRSGTSLLARLANLLGVHLGAEQRLFAAAPDNPKGFWEHRGFVRLNERLLARVGGSWREPPSLAPGWECSEEVEALRGRAQALLDEFAGHALWGWKDPRTCLTLPAWQRWLGPMRYLLCLREPLAVARSLQHRDGLPLERGVYLWLRHLQLALEHTQRERRALIVYEDLLRDFAPELARVADLIDRPELAQREDIRAAARSYIDAGLQHHQPELGRAAPDWLDRAAGVYAQLRQRRGQAEPWDVSHALRHALAALEPELERVQRTEHARWLAERERIVRELRDLVPRERSLILVDDGQWGLDAAALDRPHLPFLERGGHYWGPPSDDANAIAELQRLQQRGVQFIAFGAPSFWWLEHYAGFHRYLCERSCRRSEREGLVVFELARGAA